MSNILIVDDDVNSRKLLSANLEKRGHHTRAVPRITDALLKGQQEHPDLILVGVNLPHRHGQAGVEHLRSIPGLALTPILVLSADPLNRAWMSRWNIGDFMLKPFGIEDFLAWLRPWLDKELS
jgi:DNA-binding response OmpR family regulator